MYGKYTIAKGFKGKILLAMRMSLFKGCFFSVIQQIKLDKLINCFSNLELCKAFDMVMISLSLNFRDIDLVDVSLGG